MNHLYDVQMTWWAHAWGVWKMGLKLPSWDDDPQSGDNNEE